LKLGETTDFSITVRNRSAATIGLNPPKMSCGCVAGPVQAFEVQAKGEQRLEFAITAPESPGEFTRHVAFTLVDSPAPHWDVTVAGAVEADVWAQPSQLQMLYAPGESPSATLTVHRKANMDITNFETASDLLNVEVMYTDQTTHQLRASVNTPTSAGSATLRVRGGNEYWLTIPISWAERPAFHFFPARLAISKDHVLAGDLSKQLTLLLRESPKEASFKSEALAPWVRIAETDMSATRILLQLQLDAREIPADFAGPILRVSIDGGTVWHDYNAALTPNGE
jgi:hypothetical protein